jgi:glycine hydroxymethyltransferase
MELLMNTTALAEFVGHGVELLSKDDPVLYDLLEQEYQRQMSTLMMVAASSTADPSVLACEGLVASNVTTEGYPGARYHAGCAVIDQIEQLAIERAKTAFRARYANVQPHSGTSANEIVLFNLVKPGETILGLDLNAGGHLTHGSKASVSGQRFNAIGYGVTPQGLLDYDQIRQLARTYKPKLIVSGASAYPRIIDFSVFRDIADEVGAFLLADISHISGLVVAGVHPSPIDHAHFTTTSTYKQLYGPRGGLILMGRDHDSPSPHGKGKLSDMIQRAVFPFFQGTPDLGAISAKARALALAATPEFQAQAQRIVANAKALAQSFIDRGYEVLTGGTDNHLLLIHIFARGITGAVAERALEECNIIINKNRIAGDKKAPLVASGIRLGTNDLALRGLEPHHMPHCVDLIDRVLSAVQVLGDTDYVLDLCVKETIRAEVKRLCEQFPVPRYPIGVAEEFAGV